MIILNSVDRDMMQQIHDNSFPLPDLSDRLYICRKTVVDDGKIVAIGLVRLTAEGILITNQTLPHVTRARGSAVMINQLKQDAKSHGLSDCHVFVINDKVQKFLKHLGFENCKGGSPLVIQL